MTYNFGRYTPEGNIHRAFDHCIKDGTPIRSGEGGVLVTISGTPLFYQVCARCWPELTAAEKEALKNQAADEWAAEAQE